MKRKNLLTNISFYEGGEDERSCECPEDHFKCNTGRCVPGHYVCDGHPNCADLSDDWDCFNLTTAPISSNVTITDAIAKNDFNATTISANALQIKKPNGKFAYVCYDNWDSNMSNWICKNFGFARAITYSYIQLDTNDTSLVRINDNYRGDDSILTYSNETNLCSDNQIVTLECEKYGMFIAFFLVKSPDSNCTGSFFNILACGNYITHDKNVDDVKQWPSLAVAINEISSVHCTATIGMYFGCNGRFNSGKIKKIYSTSIF